MQNKFIDYLIMDINCKILRLAAGTQCVVHTAGSANALAEWSPLEALVCPPADHEVQNASAVRSAIRMAIATTAIVFASRAIPC